MSEIWREIIGWEGYYEVSNLGNIRSMKRTISTKHGRECNYISKPLKQTPRRDYMVVSLMKNNKKKTYLVHRLVATAFLPNPEGKKEVNHIDGNKYNNNLNNLEWATHSENLKHAYKHGLTKGANVNGNIQGENHSRAKLTDEKVRFIRKNSTLAGGKYSAKQLSQMFGVGVRYVYNIVYKECWKHID